MLLSLPNRQCHKTPDAAIMMDMATTQSDQTVPPGAPRALGDHPSPVRRRPGCRRLLCIVTGIYVVYLILLYCLQNKIVFPTHLMGRPAAALPYGAERVAIDVPLGGGQSGQVEAWLFLAPEAMAGHPVPLVIYCHGNAELIDQQEDRVAGYLNLGCSVLLPEYRGYGRCAVRRRRPPSARTWCGFMT